LKLCRPINRDDIVVPVRKAVAAAYVRGVMKGDPGAWRQSDLDQRIQGSA
jgi:hypothetical protein